MSGFEHYPEELADLVHEIKFHASICGVNLGNPAEVTACIDDKNATGSRETLRGLLILKITVETQMMEEGYELPQKA